MTLSYVEKYVLKMSPGNTSRVGRKTEFMCRTEWRSGGVRSSLSPMELNMTRPRGMPREAYTIVKTMPPVVFGVECP